jgi:hypothetical protein
VNTEASLTFRGDQMIQGFRRSTQNGTSGQRGDVTFEYRRALRYIVAGEVSYLFFAMVCVALHPGYVLKWNEGGISNYGIHEKTAVFYTLALGLLALFSHRAAQFYDDGGQRSRRLRTLLDAYAAVVTAVLLSTYFYSRNVQLKELHFGLGTVLVVLVAAGSLWLYRLWPPSVGVSVLLFVQLFGDALALATAVGALHALFVAEIVSNIGFASLLIRTAYRYDREESRRAV